MPTYEYVCRACGHLFEIVQSMRDDTLTECPECGGELRKVFAPPAISFKGSGFYATDQRKKAASAVGDKGDKGEKHSDTGSSSGSGAGDSSGSGDGSGGTKKDSTSDSPAKSSKKEPSSSSSGSSSGSSSKDGSGS